MYKVVVSSVVAALVLGSSFVSAAETKSVEAAKKDSVVSDTAVVRDQAPKMKTAGVVKNEPAGDKVEAKNEPAAKVDAKAKTKAGTEVLKDAGAESAKPAKIHGGANGKAEKKARLSISDAAATMTEAQAKTLPAKAETAKTAPAAKAEAKTEAPAKAVSPKAEAPKAGEVKTEAVKTEAPKASSPKAETPAVKAPEAKPETKTEAPVVKAPEAKADAKVEVKPEAAKPAVKTN